MITTEHLQSTRRDSITSKSGQLLTNLSTPLFIQIKVLLPHNLWARLKTQMKLIINLHKHWSMLCFNYQLCLKFQNWDLTIKHRLIISTIILQIHTLLLNWIEQVYASENIPYLNIQSILMRWQSILHSSIITKDNWAYHVYIGMQLD